MSSCVKPAKKSEKNPVVLLHCFDRFVIQVTLIIIFFLLLCTISIWIICDVCFLPCTQFLFGMELCISSAWRGWSRNVGCWCSWMGLFWLGWVQLRVTFDYFFFWLLVFYELRKRFSHLYVSWLYLYLLDSLPPCNVETKRSHLYQVNHCTFSPLLLFMKDFWFCKVSINPRVLNGAYNLENYNFLWSIIRCCTGLDFATVGLGYN